MLKLLQTHQSGPDHNLEFPSNQIIFPHKAPSICGSLLRYLPNLTKTIALSLGPCDSLAEVTHKSRGIKLSICQSPEKHSTILGIYRIAMRHIYIKGTYICMYVYLEVSEANPIQRRLGSWLHFLLIFNDAHKIHKIIYTN